MITSSTLVIPNRTDAPRHLAIIIDGNGRWATKRFLPRNAGHARGVQSVRQVVEACGKRGVEYLTLFAFSTENWRRPKEEVSLLMRLFIQTLEKEVGKLDGQGVRLRVIGDMSAFEPKLQDLIQAAEQRTAHNSTLNLTIAANYGGRWDILQAMQAMQQAHMQQMAQGQPGAPGGAGPGMQGQPPRIGAQPQQPRGGQQPPGAIHQDQMQDPQRMPR